MRVVVDASTTLSFVLDDERDETVNFMLSTLRRARMVVPAIWPYEVANGLVNAQRRRRIDEAGMAEAMQLLEHLDIEPDAAPPSIADTVQMARAQRLSSYDALYVMLAQREGIALVTRDNDMIRAAKALQVHVL